ncbi:MAG: hypothetical protein HUU34_07865 [Saprospiraceae bacterium]|nr:hypothetical protein [Saprospiraceae bacterium]
MLRMLAKVISILFHPLLMPTYMMALLLLVNPYLFGVNSIGEAEGKLLLLRIFLSTFFIPGVAIVMLRMLGMISTLEMRDKDERIGPYIITGVFYLWIFYNFLHNSLIPTAYTTFLLGAVIALFVSFFLNIFRKISAHAVGMGGLVGMVIITMLLFSYDTFTLQTAWLGAYEFNMNIVLMLVLVVAGLVGTSRLLLQAHEPADLYGGYFVGFITQFIALRFMI